MCIPAYFQKGFEVPLHQKQSQIWTEMAKQRNSLLEAAQSAEGQGYTILKTTLLPSMEALGSDELSISLTPLGRSPGGLGYGV